MTDAEFMEKLKALRTRMEASVLNAKAAGARYTALIEEAESIARNFGARDFVAGIPEPAIDWQQQAQAQQSGLGMQQAAANYSRRQPEPKRPEFGAAREDARRDIHILVSEYISSWGLE